MIQQLFNSYSSLELDVNNSVQSIRHQLLSSPQLPSSKKLNRSLIKHRLTRLRQSKENLSSKQSTTQQYQQQFFDSKDSYATKIHNHDDSDGLDIFRIIQKLNVSEVEKEMLRNYAEEAEATIDELHQLIEEYVEKLEESLQKNVNLQKSIQQSPLVCKQVSKLQQALQQCFRENLQLGKKLQQSLLTQKQLTNKLSIYQQQIPIIQTDTTSSFLKQIITQHRSTIKTLETMLQLRSESFREICRLQAQANAAMLEKYIQENRELKEMSKQGESFKLANVTRQSKLIDEEGRQVQDNRKEEQVREKKKEEQRHQMKERNKAEDQKYEEEMFQLGLKLQSMRKKGQTIQKLLQPKPGVFNIQQFSPISQEINQIPIQPKSQPKPFHSLEINSQDYLSSLTPLQKQVMSPVTYKLALRIIASILFRQEVILHQSLDNSKLSEDQKDMIQHQVFGFWDLRKKVQAKLKDLKDNDTGEDFSFATN